VRFGSLLLAASVASLFYPASAAAQTPVEVRHVRAGGATLHAIASNNRTIVAVGDAGTILSSRDGVTWARQESGVTEALFGVAYNANTSSPAFVAVGDAGRILLSADGVSWTPIAIPGLTVRLNRVSAYGGRLLIAGEAGTIVTSIDHQRWTQPASDTTASLRAIGYVSSSTIMAVGANGTVLLARSDAEDWRRVDANTSADLEAVAWPYVLGVPSSPSVDAVIVGDRGEYLVATSTPTTASGFTRYGTPTTQRLRAITPGRTALVSAGAGGTLLFKDAKAMQSAEWTVLNSGTAANLTDVAFHWTNESSSFFITGENETILQIEEKHRAWLNNLAIRAFGGDGDRVLTSGFVIQGAAPKPMLIRAAGPALASFDLSGTMPRPVLTLFDAKGAIVATNSGWTNNANVAEVRATAQAVGAFRFPEDSADSALLVTLAPGAYTAQVSDRDGIAGLALLELYDPEREPGNRPRLANLSARCFVGAGESIAIPGITSRGNRMPRLLIRAIGPSLARFGVTGTLANPKIEVISLNTFISHGVVSTLNFAVATNDTWNAAETQPAAGSGAAVGSPDDIRAKAAAAGAFPLDEDTRDAALLVTIDPGRHSIQVSGADGRSGIALIEIYDVSDL
jgi:photosystem II stability/assembly factor-like uncharacterized protein